MKQSEKQLIFSKNIKPIIINMTYFLVLNPGSRAGSSKKKFAGIFDILNSLGIKYDYKITEKLEDAFIFSREANLKNYDRIIAVGGDGTINNVINGFFDQDGKRISNASFGVIYTGTSPDFCKSYNIPIRLEDAVNTIVNPKILSIRIGKIMLSKSSGETNNLLHGQEDPIVKYFACCVNAGLGATLARRANSGIRKYLGDFLGTFSSLIATIAQYKPVNFNCKFDDQEKTIQKCYNLSIGITPLIASGIKVPKKQDCEDEFYIMGTCNLKFSNITGVLKKIYSGHQFENNDSLWIDYAKKIDIFSNSNSSEVEFDGDPAGYIPCNISFADDNLDVLVSH
jgi:diacylglycerol kinase family enzyme